MRFGILFAAALAFGLSPLTGFTADGAASAQQATGGSSMPAAAPATFSRPSFITATSGQAGPAVAIGEAASDLRAPEQSVSPLSSKTTFQTYVEVSTGRQLEVFGRDLFRNVPSTFAPLHAVQVNPDYVIGPGDAIQIRGWGMVDIDATLSVNRSGEVYIPQVGAVNVSGVRYRDLQPYLKKAIGRIFTNFDLSASIAQTRSVQVYVVGNARRPGTYTLSAMSTLLNALFVSGGPSEIGSMRNIKVKRGSRTINFDLYDILIYGDKTSDVDLQDGDVIYIGEVGPQIAIIGGVKKQAIYELRNDCSAAEVLAWAGGFESAAAFRNIIVEKNVDGKFQTVAELVADRNSVMDKLAKLPIRPTDIIRVIVPGAEPIEVKVEREFVRVDGEVETSGVYEIKKGETLRELVTRIGGVTPKAYVYGTRLERESVKKLQQQKIDEAAERFENDIEASANQRLASVTEADAAEAIKSEAEAQRRLAQKLRSVKAQGRIVLNMPGADSKTDNLPELPLMDGDVVYIPQRPATVDVIGAVYQQSTFIWDEGKRHQRLRTQRRRSQQDR
ncbi:MAG: capsule biosynthesis protein [Pelodictyon luteolum]|uniref:Capsule biosynthesis protein n=1 Tax=Pelodictyon luteolum TaxID=1100 RepID=A0A165MGA6_PELLU|nr:SLBB domain-containing protein [Pelodictyon luteolum]KZK75214.1 MAG: capsule biosynthesis protein [Pelodictyon luteolum]